MYTGSRGWAIIEFRSLLRNIRRKKAIGEGVYRRVYDLGNGYVLKAAKSRPGRRCNRREVKIYRSSPYKIKKHLGKIVAYRDDYRMLIMKKYVRKLPASKEYQRKFLELVSRFKQHGIILYDVVRRHGRPNERNIRLKPNGRIVVIDYGNLKRRK